MRPRKRYLARAYPPIELKNIDSTVPADARKIELQIYRQNVTGPCTVSLLAKRVRKLSRLIVLLEIFQRRKEGVFVQHIFVFDRRADEPEKRQQNDDGNDAEQSNQPHTLPPAGERMAKAAAQSPRSK